MMMGMPVILSELTVQCKNALQSRAFAYRQSLGPASHVVNVFCRRTSGFALGYYDAQTAFAGDDAVQVH